MAIRRCLNILWYWRLKGWEWFWLNKSVPLIKLTKSISGTPWLEKSGKIIYKFWGARFKTQSFVENFFPKLKWSNASEAGIEWYSNYQKNFKVGTISFFLCQGEGLTCLQPGDIQVKNLLIKCSNYHRARKLVACASIVVFYFHYFHWLKIYQIFLRINTWEFSLTVNWTHHGCWKGPVSLVKWMNLFFYVD